MGLRFENEMEIEESCPQDLINYAGEKDAQYLAQLPIEPVRGNTKLEEVPFIYPPQEALSSEMRNRTKLMYEDPQVFENDKNTALLQEIRKHGFNQFDFQYYMTPAKNILEKQTIQRVE